MKVHTSDLDPGDPFVVGAFDAGPFAWVRVGPARWVEAVFEREHYGSVVLGGYS